MARLFFLLGFEHPGAGLWLPAYNKVKTTTDRAIGYRPSQLPAEGLFLTSTEASTDRAMPDNLLMRPCSIFLTCTR